MLQPTLMLENMTQYTVSNTACIKWWRLKYETKTIKQ